MNIIAQLNKFDCGLFAVTNMTEIAYGDHPVKLESPFNIIPIPFRITNAFNRKLGLKCGIPLTGNLDQK